MYAKHEYSYNIIKFKNNKKTIIKVMSINFETNI